MPLKKLHLINFEEHQDTTIDFAPGITVIYGTSDQGKSSIRRAITWVARNKPVGPRSVRDNTKECKAVIRFDDTPAITRGRSGSKNYYKIGSTKTDGEGVNIFRAFSTKVPEEVSNLINMGDANIQEQFKKYYLLEDPPGQVAKTIHALLGMDLVDTTASVVNRAISQQGKQVTQCESKIAQTKGEIKKYGHVEKAEADFKDLEITIHNQEQIESKIRNLHTLVEKCRILHERMLAASIPLDIEEDARGIMEEILAIETRESQLKRLEQFIPKLTTIERRTAHLTEWLTSEKEARNIQKEIVDISTQEARIKPLIDKLNKIQAINKQIAKVEEIQQRNEASLEELKKEIKICPVCNRPFKEKR
jgi:exonuclease SbcC